MPSIPRAIWARASCTPSCRLPPKAPPTGATLRSPSAAPWSAEPPRVCWPNWWVSRNALCRDAVGRRQRRVHRPPYLAGFERGATIIRSSLFQGLQPGADLRQAADDDHGHPGVAPPGADQVRLRCEDDLDFAGVVRASARAGTLHALSQLMQNPAEFVGHGSVQAGKENGRHSAPLYGGIRKGNKANLVLIVLYSGRLVQSVFLMARIIEHGFASRPTTPPASRVPSATPPFPSRGCAPAGRRAFR